MPSCLFPDKIMNRNPERSLMNGGENVVEFSLPGTGSMK